MKVTSKVDDLKRIIKESSLTPVGLVPTMGALHEGHLSLVSSAIASSSLVVVSIYVNPTQFNDKEDFSRYPRTTEADLDLLGKLMRETDVVFMPTDDEMYPERDERQFDFGNLEKVMEGPLRPGHFNGVGQIVSKLFLQVEPDIAFFGQKDFQQVAVIKNLVKQMDSDIKIVPCPIVREPDGLAMSSRNRLLVPDIRKAAPAIYKAISEASKMFKKGEIREIKQFVSESIASTGKLEVEYFEIVDDTELEPLTQNADIINSRKYFGCVAVKAGKIRLIDNIAME